MRTFRSTTRVTFTCTEPGASTFIQQADARLRANAQIRMAHAKRNDADQKLVGTWFADLHLFEQHWFRLRYS